MKIEDLWKALDKEAVAGKTGDSGWLVRLAQPTAECVLFVGLDIQTLRRAVLLRLPSGSIPARRRWPRCKGLEPLAVKIGGNTHFGVALKDSRFNDVFAALSEDLVRRVTCAKDPASQSKVFLGQLARWQKFLSASIEGLGDEAQRGLWGELYVLREVLLPKMGKAAAYGWKGPERAHQDFQIAKFALEVKTTLAKQPQVVCITSERQLDDCALNSLFLSVLALDVRDDSGESLPGLVNSLRGKLVADAAALEKFEDGLLAAGYLDSHSTRYEERCYTVRSLGFFRVGGKFPKLIESDMPSGVGNVSYALSVAACEPFKVTLGDVQTAMTAGPECGARRKKHA